MHDKTGHAWRAFESKDNSLASELWISLINSTTDPEARDGFRAQYCYVLVAMEKYNEARLIYEELFQRYGDHRHLHQLGMVERQAGNFEMALQIFEQEKALISTDDHLAVAANLYELGKVSELLSRLNVAKDLATQCLGNMGYEVKKREMHLRSGVINIGGTIDPFIGPRQRCMEVLDFEWLALFPLVTEVLINLL